MNNSQRIVTSAVSAALAAGMPSCNVHPYVGLVVMRLAADNVGLPSAVRRTDRLLKKIMTTDWKAVEKSTLTGEKIAYGLTEEEQVKLLTEVTRIAIKVDHG